MSEISDDSRSILSECRLCPRNCGVDRIAGERGVCGAPGVLKVARAAPHFWEEPCISGQNGSGAIFFSGCGLRCSFCQNAPISLGRYGREITVEKLCEIFFSLQSQGVHNINLVTGTMYLPLIRDAIRIARADGFSLPFVYNCGGYESVDALKLLDGRIDVYLPDLKFCDPRVAGKYAGVKDYFARASDALREMFRQTGPLLLGDDGLLKRGMIVRHLMLPGELFDTRRILLYLTETYGNAIYISLMNQYTPPDPPRENAPTHPLSPGHYEKMVDFLVERGQINAFVQEAGTDSSSFIPPFDMTGI